MRPCIGGAQQRFSGEWLTSVLSQNALSAGTWAKPHTQHFKKYKKDEKASDLGTSSSLYSGAAPHFCDVQQETSYS